MVAILIFIGFFSTVIFGIWFSSKNRKEHGELILKALPVYDFDKIDVRLTQTSVGPGRVGGGMPSKAIMYLSSDFILLVHRSVFCVTENMPVLFVKDEKERQKIRISNAVVPVSVKLTAWNAIVIKYKKSKIFVFEYHLQINLLKKSDVSRLEKLKNWITVG